MANILVVDDELGIRDLLSEILNDEGISPDEVLLLRVTDDGSRAELLSSLPDASDLDLGLTISDVVDDLIAPDDLTGLFKAARSRR